MNEKLKHNHFIKTYEKKIKDLRENYYNNAIQHNNTSNLVFVPKLVNILGIAISMFIIFNSYLKFQNFLIVLIFLILTNILNRILIKVLKLQNQNEYETEIKKHGYLSINEYEQKLIKYVAGPTGEYTKILQEQIVKHNITSKTRKIMDFKGNIYYIWTSKKIDKIIILNTNTYEKPIPKTYRLSQIRYYRIDRRNQIVVLKTDMEELYLKIAATKIFDELFPDKNYDNLKTFTPEQHICDFEVYVNTRKRELIKDNEITKVNANNSFLIAIIIIGIFFIVPYLKGYLEKIEVFVLIFEVLLIPILNKNLKTIIALPFSIDEDKILIEKLNSDSKTIGRFNELKVALKIYDKYDTIYNKQGIEYKTWIANGYFHVFLNTIFTNVVYMAINPSSIEYYKIEKNECIIKLKDKTLVFHQSAYPVFQRMIPNKDGAWLKKIAKNAR